MNQEPLEPQTKRTNSDGRPFSTSAGALVAYFALAYGFTWSFHLTIPLLGWEFSMDRVGPLLLYIFGLLGPLFGAVVVTWRIGGGMRSSSSCGVESNGASL